MTDAPLGAALADLWDALVEPGCAACRTSRVREQRTLVYLVRDYATDGDVQRRVTRPRALCSRHLWLMVQIEGRSRPPVGAALLLERALAAHATALRSRTHEEAACVVCAERDRDERAELRDLAAAVAAGHQRVNDRLARADPFCALHIQLLVVDPAAGPIVERAIARVLALRRQSARSAFSVLAGSRFAERP